MSNKTVGVSPEVHEKLKGLKKIERETFNDVIKRLIDGETKTR